LQGTWANTIARFIGLLLRGASHITELSRLAKKDRKQSLHSGLTVLHEGLTKSTLAGEYSPQGALRNFTYFMLNVTAK
jgi:hypothetical protein